MKEERHSQRCVDLRRRLREVEDHNEVVVVSIARTRRLIQRARLERALLLERLEQVSTAGRDPDAEETPPPSPLLTTQSGSATRGYKRSSTAGGSGAAGGSGTATSTPVNLKRRKTASSSTSSKRATPAERAAIAAEKAAAAAAAAVRADDDVSALGQANTSNAGADTSAADISTKTETPTRSSKRGPSLRLTLSTRRSSASSAANTSSASANTTNKSSNGAGADADTSGGVSSSGSAGRVPWKPMKASELYRSDNPKGPAWDELDAESQEPFRSSARGLRVRYAREMAALSPNNLTEAQRRAQDRSKSVIRAIVDDNLNEDDPRLDSHLAHLDDSDGDASVAAPAADDDEDNDHMDSGDDDDDDENDNDEEEDEDDDEGASSSRQEGRRASNGHSRKPEEPTDDEAHTSAAESPYRQEPSEVYSATVSEAPTDSMSEGEGEGQSEL